MQKSYTSDLAKTSFALFITKIAIVMAWIFQILLSEVLGVPSTIEGGYNQTERDRDSSFSFYDQESRYLYPKRAYPYYALIEADIRKGDCNDATVPCAHIMPDVWAGGKQDVKDGQGTSNSQDKILSY